MTSGRPQPTIRVGILGLGGGASIMIPKFAGTPGFSITAAADTDPKILDRFKQDFPAVETYTSAEGLCASKSVDFVYIATPNMVHREHTVMALEHGKHALVEKPMTIALADAMAMVDSADRNGVLLGVNVANTFDPRVQKMREFAESREFGELRLLNYWRYADWLYRPRAAEELTPEWGGGILWRQGGHQLDLMRAIGGGLVRSVRGTAQVWDSGRRVVGAHSAFFEFDNGAAATAVFTGHDHYNSRELVYGFEPSEELDPSAHARGRRSLLLHADDPDWETRQKRALRYGSSSQNRTVSRAEAGWVLGGPMIASYDHADVKLSPRGLVVYGDTECWEIPLVTDLDCRDYRLRAFHAALVEDKPMACDGRWGTATVELLLAIERSGQERHEIELEHQVAYVG